MVGEETCADVVMTQEGAGVTQNSYLGYNTTEGSQAGEGFEDGKAAQCGGMAAAVVLPGLGREAGEAQEGPRVQLIIDDMEEGEEDQADAVAEEEGEEEVGGAANDASVEEEESEDEEQDRREYGIYQCLPVPSGEPNWEEGEPQTVEEYLRRVRYEARRLPDVVTAPPPPPPSPPPPLPSEAAERGQQHAADAPHTQQQPPGQQQQREGVQGRTHYGSRYLPVDQGVPTCHPSLQPSAAWIKDFLLQFAQLRRRLHREYELTSGQVAPGGRAAAAAYGQPLLRVAAVAGDGNGAMEAAAQAELAALMLDPPSACMPELMQLQGLDQLQVRRQLHSVVREVVRRERLDPEAAAQLYALSARIEKPLHAGTCALYRQLLRLCAAQRAAVPLEAAASDPVLPHLNITITLAGAFFGQDEELAAMWEEDEE